MYVATNLLSTTSSPTQGDLQLSFLGMFTSLKNNMKTSSQSRKQVAAAILQKLERYWILHLSESSSISAILDPRYKTTIFVNEKEKEQSIQHLHRLYEAYKPDFIVSKNTSFETSGLSSRNFFLNIINPNLNSHSNSNPNFEEVEHYLNTSVDINSDSLLWWKSHQSEYPILSKIACDYLVIQTTSVASEQAFSIAGNTITKTRNRLYPETAKACLCLKSWIQNGLLKDKLNIEDTEKKDNSKKDETIVIE
jgi:hypothetical protein